MDETKDLMKKFADLTDYQPLHRARPDLLCDGALPPPLPCFDGKLHRMLQ